jgi:hypothetical protein
MPDDDFTSLSKQFQTLTKQLKDSRDPKTRKRLLAEIRNVIGTLDRLIVKEYPKLPRVSVPVRARRT